MNRLPIEVIREHILPFTYNPQPKEICDDIKSFFNIRKHLCKMYYDRWKDTFEYEENADYNWLENDILRFYNNDIALMNGVHIDYINRYKRLFMLNDKGREDINHLIRLYLRYDSKQMVNRLLGILTSKERIDLVDFVENRLT